jgi:hypothetical protein
MPALRAQLPQPRQAARLLRRAAPRPCAHRRSAMQPLSASADVPEDTPLHVTTPLVFSNALTAALGTGAPVFLKLEALQPCGSFKLRGIGRECVRARHAGATRFVSSSGGNAGLAVAHAARALGMPATVVRRSACVQCVCAAHSRVRSSECVRVLCALPQVLPTSTPEFVRLRLEAYGAAVEARARTHAHTHAHSDANNSRSHAPPHALTPFLCRTRCPARSGPRRTRLPARWRPPAAAR